jgi:2-keto-4-pentenoate hydratase
MLNGPPIAFDTMSHADALREFVVTTRDGTGKVLEVGRGTSIMGDPLQAVLWIIKDQNARGVRLRAVTGWGWVRCRASDRHPG